ncbi:sensor histidine kinase [Niabella drilacis]|uniref:Histidine kinase n=1 Tax=Niabella drilacis (strain DSM 25811 / CCM 8410 / CCUG 62505 / LMG 26954 / E90) TaxID=1285928 RepID=A0A1G7A3C4_NIADE|nr:histidine kinase [Niabella drilacis]SDE08396.1 Histidine kinase [Niabella drilacis]
MNRMASGISPAQHRLSILVLLSLFLCFTADAQTKYGSRMLFFNDSTAIFIGNNYIRNNDNIQYQPFDVKMPFRDFYFTIYGSRVMITTYNMQDLLKKGGYTTQSAIRDTVKADIPYFNLATLEYHLDKKGTADTQWKPVLSSNAYPDTVVRSIHARKTIFYRSGYLLCDDSLANGETITLSFRQRNDNTAFLKIHLTKKSALESPPCLMGVLENHNKNTGLVPFIRQALEQYQSWNTKFYEDRPGQSDTGNITLLPDTKAAYYFRERDDIANDSIFEYRLLTGNDQTAPWKKSDHIIFITQLKAGRQYELQVRYADKPQYIYTKKFHTARLWYQALWFKGGIAAFSLLALLLLLSYAKQKRQQRLQREQSNKIKMLYAQLNPHFIFNALGSIQGLLNNSRIEEANQYLSGFGSLLRATFDGTNKRYITLEAELKNLKIYTNLEQLRQFFRYTTTFDPGIAPQEIEMLPLLFQPLIENAVKHGHKNDSGTLVVTLSVKRQKNNIRILVEDNGCGFDTSRPHAGNGLRLVRERISLFNNTSAIRKIKFHIKSGAGGTSVILEFVNWIENDQDTYNRR